MINHANSKENFDQFVDFLSHFCTELSTGLSPEYALAKSAQHFGHQTPKLLQGVLESVLEGTQSFSTAWATATNEYHNEGFKRLMDLLGRFIGRGANVGGSRMQKVLQQIRRNRSLAKNRLNIIKAQRAKVIALAIVTSAVLGMVSGIAPILSIAFSGFNTFGQFQEIPTMVSIQLFATLLLTVLISAYRLTQSVGSSFRVLLLCALAFIMTHLLTANLFSLIP